MKYVLLKEVLDYDLLEVSHKAFRSEADIIDSLLHYTEILEKQSVTISEQVEQLIRQSSEHKASSVVEAFFAEFELSSNEGLALMHLAEALLRIPDIETKDAFIQDKLAPADWDKHVNRSDSNIVNISMLGLSVVGKMLELREQNHHYIARVLARIINRLGEPLIRHVFEQAMQRFGQHFVLGETIEKGIEKSHKLHDQGYCLSYDMLGESSRTNEQACYYTEKYKEAIEAIAKAQTKESLYERDSISIKLSAIYPRMELSKLEDVFEQLLPRLESICYLAKTHHIMVTIDAEETWRTDITLLVFKALLHSKKLAGFEGIGIAVQTYQKRAFYMLDWLAALAEQLGIRIPVRLVKGAYWDSEIKHAQMEGLLNYPLFTQKAHTDISYLACARKVLQQKSCFYPQFASHNAHSVVSTLQMKADQDYEFQRLQGMGEELYAQLVKEHRCRIYAPIGEHDQLLSYLIRRILENGANSSFIHQLAQQSSDDEEVPLWMENPIATVRQASTREEAFPLPLALYHHAYVARDNSIGVDMGNFSSLAGLLEELRNYKSTLWHAVPLVAGKEICDKKGKNQTVIAPHNHIEKVGRVTHASHHLCDEALTSAVQGFTSWSQTSVVKRAMVLERLADLLILNRNELIALCVREAGKTIKDAIAEVREAEDFCRYYAALAETALESHYLESPTGETNEYIRMGRGVFICISPWNFPLAIFTGQIAAALVAGNSVIAKPASNASLIGFYMVKLWFQAGLPRDVLHYLPGPGGKLGEYLTQDKRIAGIAFTGGGDTADSIRKHLTKRGDTIIPFIAETGGINAMIVDSTALLEATVDDVITSAFGSAGQRCSALRVLFVQEEIADGLLAMLEGAMKEMTIGDPMDLATDMGAVISASAKETIEAHIHKMKKSCIRFFARPVDRNTHDRGHFVPPHVFEIASLSELTSEVFGPILHVIRYKREELKEVVESINATKYGLTLGVQSRLQSTIDFVTSQAHVGNIYINRAMTGATVGVQPFGGQGLSGTGPKAGGPDYLSAFTTEKVVSTNTVAIGGDIELLS